MKTLLRVEADSVEKLNLLIRVAREMGISVEGNTLSNIALPGKALTREQGEKLADEMDADADWVSEADAPAYLASLKKEWSNLSQ